MKERFIELEADEKLIVTYKQQEIVEQPNPQKDKGAFKYRVALTGDYHINTEGDKAEAVADLINSMDYYVKRGVSFVSSLGDFCEYNDNDLYLFHEIYNERWFKPHFLRLHCCMGNHDYLRIYHTRLESDPDYKNPDECMMMWQKTISPFHEPESELHFFEYGAHWNDPRDTGERTIKSKHNYWFEKDGDIWVYASLDYGASDPKLNIWDDVSRGFNLLNHEDPYVQQMVAYVQDTNYVREDGRFDYQFYHPNVMVWVKEILDANRDRRVIINWHKNLPHKAGDGLGNYSHLRVWPYTDSLAVKKKYYSGSNSLCGLTFWYIDKLTNEYTNAIFISAHTHSSVENGEMFCNKDYVVRKPTGNEVTPLVDNLDSLNGTQYDYRLYQRESNTPCGDSAWTIGLPSLSKPIDVNGKTLYGASEGAVMNVYENGIEIECIRFKEEGSTEYTNDIIRTVEL